MVKANIMKIKMLIQMSGSTMYEQGKEYEVSQAKGERLISFKYAEEVKTVKKTPKNAKKVSNNKPTGNGTRNTKRSKGTPKK